MFAAINIVGVTILTLGALAVFFILYMYIDTVKHVIKYAPPLAKTHSAFVLSVYPVSKCIITWTFTQFKNDLSIPRNLQYLRIITVLKN